MDPRGTVLLPALQALSINAFDGAMMQFLLCDTGCIEACHPNLHGGHNVFTKALHSAHEHDLEHEVLSGTEVNQRFPGYQLPPEFKVLYPSLGLLANSHDQILLIPLKEFSAQPEPITSQDRLCIWPDAVHNHELSI